jgi:hypothetical protein
MNGSVVEAILAYPYRKIKVEMVVVGAKIIMFDPPKWGHCCDIHWEHKLNKK